MKVYLNRTQLARRLKIAPQTLRDRIEGGTIKPDAKDDNGNDLFDLANLMKIQLACAPV